MVVETFFSEAQSFLRRHSKEVLEEFFKGKLKGNWHPMGFAVFHLGDQKGLGKLRFHIWPTDLRICLVGQPEIHSHPRHICSQCIAGVYKDCVYSYMKANEEEEGVLQGFRVKNSSNIESELFPIPSWYKVSAIENRIIKAGDFHCLAAGVLHSTDISKLEFACTILLTSEENDNAKLFFVGARNLDRLRYERPPVTPDQYNQIINNLNSELEC